MQKRVLGLLIISLVIIVSIQFISSASCDIVDSDACIGGKYIVMGVSDLTNAHGEFPDEGTYGYVLCCDFQKVRGTICVGTNKIIGLSSSTNAHAEEPYPIGGATYTNSVCYDDLECIRTSNSCPTDYPLSVLSLSNYTNAHIGATGDYLNYQICCKGSATAAETCELTNASWEYEEVFEGTNVGLVVKGTDCNSVGIKFEVYKKGILGIWTKIDDSPSDTTFSGDTATGYWSAEEPGKFYFKATLIEDESKTINSKTLGNPLLTVNEFKTGDCDIVLCSEYTLDSMCNTDFCGIVESSSENIDCSDSAINCSCSWDSEAGESGECEFIASSEGGEINGEEFGAGTCSSKQETTDDCSNGYLTYNLIVEWIGEGERPSWCDNSTETIECSAQVQLPFINTYSILIAIALIVLIYIILTRRKKKTSRKKRK